MKRISALMFVAAILCVSVAKAQILPPYYNNFENAGSTNGWSHYALSGSDDWQLGTPVKMYLKNTFSGNNAWSTKLDGTFTAASVMCLETPSFNLSAPGINYRLGFAHEYETYSYHGGNIEYSTDNGTTWTVLNGTATEKRQWYTNTSCSALGGQPSWSDLGYSSFNVSYHSLTFLAGQTNVKFRFKFGGTSNPQDGWVIDDFSIEENKPNVYAIQTLPTHATKTCPTFDIKLNMVYSGIVTSSFSNKTEYYWSTDSIFDAGDALLGTKVQAISGSVAWNKTFTMPASIPAGTYYVFHKSDADNLLTELYESDNLGKAVLVIDSIYNSPLISSFDDSTSAWQKRGGNDWQLSKINTPGFEGAHSGNLVWSIDNTGPYEVNYMESPHMNLTQSDSMTVSFWYRLKRIITFFPYNTTLQYTTACNTGSTTNLVNLPVMRDNTWDFFSATLPSGSTVTDLQLRIYNGNGYTGACCYNDITMVLDDIYIGHAEPDLSIERKEPQFCTSASSSATLKYYLNNSGRARATATTTSFYWSTDSIFDGSDILLGTNAEPVFNDTARVWRTFAYTKPTTAAGTYYLIYFLDGANTVTEMREYNNTGFFVLNQQVAFTVPYFNDFETQIDGWSHKALIGKDDWQWTNPKGHVIDQAFSGTKGWISNDSAPTSLKSRMLLYTPVFDFSASVSPVMAFDMKCDEWKMNMSYSIDGGATWKVLDTTSQSYCRWYYPMEYEDYGGGDRNYYLPNSTDILFAAPYERTFAVYSQYNGREAKRTTHYVLDLRFLAGQSNVRFRYNLATLNRNGYAPSYQPDGVFIDNFAIKEAFMDLTVDYKKALMISSKAQKIKFSMNVKNNGNYSSNAGVVKYYVSSDTTLDGGDFYLGQEPLPKVRPDMSQYLNVMFTAPTVLSGYKYLLYQLDATATTTESNEVNNTSFWKLALDSLKGFPYNNDFSDSIMNGWHQYQINQSGVQVKNGFRFRNMTAPSEYLYSTQIVSGQIFTDRANGVQLISQIPIWHLETPAFDFSLMDTISLSFDMLCTGRTYFNATDGGNLEFSRDGGNTWTVLTTAHGQATNWYNYTDLINLYDQPGWAENGQYLTRKMDISFLAGEPHVVFRFKYRSNWEYYGSGYLQGMRIDNFHVERVSIDYVANNHQSVVNANVAQSQLTLNGSLSNTGITNGRASNTKFYWSKDSIFDVTDQLITTVAQSPINAGATVALSASVTYPTPVDSLVYYVFYKTDADNILAETNETNNVGSFKIVFDPFADYAAGTVLDTLYSNAADDVLNVPYSILNDGLANGPSTTTAFYWSDDDVLDAGDVLLHSQNEPSVLSKDTLVTSLTLTLPVTLTQTKYYLLYKIDQPNVLAEGNETNNLGTFLVIFPKANYTAPAVPNTVNVLVANPTINVPYSVINNGGLDGVASQTFLYWSEDNVLDGGDAMIKNNAQAIVYAGDTLVTTTTITYPTPLTQTTYYVLTQSDYYNIVSESDETDNVGAVQILFDAITGTDPAVAGGSMRLYTNNKKLYVNAAGGSAQNRYTMNVLNAQGQLQFSKEITLEEGLNSFSLPDNLASGIYLISIVNDAHSYSVKAEIQN